MPGSTFNPRPRSINEVVDYILVRLGAQLLEINVTEEQIKNAISDAVVYFQEHHVDGTYRGYFKTKINPTKLVLNSNVENIAKVGDIVISNIFTAKIHSISSDFLTINLKDLEFISDEQIANNQTISINDVDFTIASFSLGNNELGYVEIPENIEAIVQVLPIPHQSDPMFTNGFNMNNSDLFHYKGQGLGISFYISQMREDVTSWLTRLRPWANFNRYLNRAYLNSFDYNSNIDCWIVFEVLTSVDPEEFPQMYGDTWFLNYVVEKVRLQWGENLSKFSEVALLNGVKVDGPGMVARASERLKELEEEMDLRYRQPDEFFMA